MRERVRREMQIQPGQFAGERPRPGVAADDRHRRGVAHCDLKRAPNTILGEDGRPYIVDWSASICATEFRFFPLTRIYERFLRDDYLAIVKLRLNYSPESVTNDEKRAYYHHGRAEKAVRKARDRLRELLQKLA